MGMTIVEKILAQHAGKNEVIPGDILDVMIDARAARDFGGANVVSNLEANGLTVDNPSRTFFTFDCNPTGSDQKYAANQHKCRIFARENDIKVYDIDQGIGTHLLMDEGLAWPGSTAVSTDSHANILGAIGAFGQGMGDKDIAAAWHKGKIWFKVPPSVKIVLNGLRPVGLSAKDIVLNLLGIYGANSLLGCSVEICGDAAEGFTLDERITIASMATEMGAIIILLTPDEQIYRYCEQQTGKKIDRIFADPDANYERVDVVDISTFKPMVSLPGKPHDTAGLPEEKVFIDSAFIGSCTNGRIEDMREAAAVLKSRKVAPWVVLKIVPSTNNVWEQALEEGLISIFKQAGALLSNAGCAGCAAGQVGQNGPGEVTLSTGNRNFPGKQGQGEVYLASPAIVAASAVAGYITEPGLIPDVPVTRIFKTGIRKEKTEKAKTDPKVMPVEATGKVWLIKQDNIDTDMIYHNRYLTITRIEEMGQYTFDNLKGFESFAKEADPGDIVIAGKNFGAGSSRQQAVDCFLSLGIRCIIAESFGAIYERNAINAAFPIVSCRSISELELAQGDDLYINFETGEVKNLTKNKIVMADPFSDVQMEIYKNNGLF